MFREIIFILLGLLSFNTVAVDGASITFVVPTAPAALAPRLGSDIGSSSFSSPILPVEELPLSPIPTVPLIPELQPPPDESRLQNLLRMFNSWIEGYKEKVTTTEFRTPISTPLSVTKEIRSENFEKIQKKLGTEERLFNMSGLFEEYHQKVRSISPKSDVFSDYHQKIKDVV